MARCVEDTKGVVHIAGVVKVDEITVLQPFCDGEVLHYPHAECERVRATWHQARIAEALALTVWLREAHRDVSA